MNRIQCLRQILAEDGIERTPTEVKLAIKLLKSVSFEEYLKYSSLTDDDIRKMAIGTGHTYKDAKSVVDIVLYVGNLKYNLNN